VHGAHDSSSFILLHEHSNGFQIIYTNCPRNVFQGNVLLRKVFPGKVLSGKRPLPDRRIHTQSTRLTVDAASMQPANAWVSWSSTSS